MKVVINYIEMNLQEGDEVQIENHECGRCESTHTEVTVIRNNKQIAHFGEYVRLAGRQSHPLFPKGEIFGDVIEPKKGQ